MVWLFEPPSPPGPPLCARVLLCTTIYDHVVLKAGQVLGLFRACFDWVAVMCQSDINTELVLTAVTNTANTS